MVKYRLRLNSLAGLDEDLKKRVFKDVNYLYVTSYEKVGNYLEGTIEESSLVRNTTNYFPFKIPCKIVYSIEEVI